MIARDGKKMIGLWLEEGIFGEKLPEVEKLKGVPQPEEYHGEGDAFVHTMLAVEEVADDADIRVFWATLLHDIGKSVTTELVGGRWRSFGHAEAGAGMTAAIMDRLDMTQFSQDVTWLVKNHLFHFSWQIKPHAKLTRNQLRFMEHPLFPLLLEVCAADAAASIGKNTRKTEMLKMITELFADLKK